MGASSVRVDGGALGANPKQLQDLPNYHAYLRPLINGFTGQTTYTLSCLAPAGTTLTKTATVRIIPTFQEL